MSSQTESATTIDYLIIGQGLAGSVLAHQLIIHGKRVLVIDNNHYQSSSQVAAGIINPITGPRLALTEDFNMLYPKAKNYYLALENLLNTTLWQQLEQHRKIQDQSQQDYYRRRIKHEKYESSLGNETTSPYFSNDSNSIEILLSALVDTKKLISKTKSWLIDNESYCAYKFDYHKIQETENGLNIEDINAKYIVFCEGFQAINNPWLSHLPFKLSKGEILTIETEQPTTHLLNWGNWLTPFGSDAKLGSNYQWGDLTFSPDNKIKDQLLDSLDKNTNIKGNVIKHEVGIRPTTTQRRPYIGALKNLAGAYCFNGFGSKGCLLIPHFANLFCEHLINNKPLDTELTQWL